MSTNPNGPALIDASAVAGISIPPGIGSFARARFTAADAEPAPASPAEAAGADSGAIAAESAQEAPQAAEGMPTAAPALPVASAAPAAPPAAHAVAVEPAAPSSRAAPEIADTLPAPRFVGGLRQRRFALDYPIEYAGRVYEAITLRRPTSAEVGHFFEQLVVQAAEDPNGRTMLPVFMDDEGDPVPEAVIEFLDGADDERISGAVMDFLPPRLQRFQATMQPDFSRPPGEPTEVTS